MKRGDLVIDRCKNPSHTSGLGIILGECYSASKCKWYNVYYFKSNSVKAEMVDNIKLVNNET
tara:strand:+ start:492 stop:677 length:186 start_codon:yes stop_codon:yes gene_type:complete